MPVEKPVREECLIVFFAFVFFAFVILLGSPLTMLMFEADGACISDPFFCDRDNLAEVFHICPTFR